jgi:hypothetical protein
MFHSQVAGKTLLHFYGKESLAAFIGQADLKSKVLEP